MVHTMSLSTFNKKNRTIVCLIKVSCCYVMALTLPLCKMVTNENVHVCGRCGYKSRTKTLLRSHLKRKRECDPVLGDASRESLLAELEAKPRATRAKKSKYFNLEDLRDDCGLTFAYDNAAYDYNVLKPFGEEDVDGMEKEHRDLLIRCVVEKDVEPVADIIFCDKPSNKNVRVKSIKWNLMESWNGTKWMMSDANDTLNEVLITCYRVMMACVRANYDMVANECQDYDDMEVKDVTDWLDSITEDETLRAPIRRRIMLLFINKMTVA